ncbi:MAG: ATP-binding protein [Gemmatimonadota bacterium]
MKRVVIGTVAALVSMALLTAAMLPLRDHLSIATTALIMVVPVVVGVVVGGFPAGVISVTAGFLTYVFFFIPPYLTWRVGALQNWAAVGVYALVMLPVARVVAGMNAARAKERRQGEEIRQLFELSDLLVEDKPLDVLLSVIVTTLADVFGARQVAIVLPSESGALEIAATAGEPLTPGQLQRVLPANGSPAGPDAQPRAVGDLFALDLTAAGRPVGLLVLSGDAAQRHEREPLLLFANQVALAVERVQLREQALRTRLTGEMERLAKTLVAAAAHDLRAPLASIKGSSSTLSDDSLDLSAQARQDLAKMIDVQADRLADLVQNLLDMSRIQAGVLQPRCSVASLADLVTAVLGDLAPQARGHSVEVDLPADLPLIDVDVVLISRVLTNLLENAFRHNPKGLPITVTAGPAGDGTVELSVADHGPGIDPARRSQIFGMLARREGDVGAGLGLAIARTFVEAHGQRIWAGDAPGGGACFSFTLPVAAPLPEEPQLAAHPHH